MVTSSLLMELILVIGLFFIVRYVVHHAVKDEHRLHEEKGQAQKAYQDALEELAKNPSDQILVQRCHLTGELYYRFEIPDYYNHPIDSFATAYPTFIDNKVTRIHKVEEDIHDLVSMNKAA